jgi:hypothetical protein
MRRLLNGLVVLAILGAMPMLALADNQEVANDIAKSLRDSGRLEHYKIGVRYQEGTVWVRGYVSDQQQMAAALNLAAATKGVERVVNELQIGVPKAQAASAPKPQVASAPAVQAAPERETVANAPTPLALKSTAMPPEETNKVRTADMVSQPGVQATSQARFRLVATPAEQPRQVQTLGRRTQSLKPTPVQQTVGIPAQRQPQYRVAQRPMPVAYTQAQPMPQQMGQVPGGPMPAYTAGMGGGVAPVQYDQPHMPNHAWPSYASYPNYAAVTYPKQYSPTAWPFIGPFYPYPQVPLGWRRVSLEWDDGWWMLDFKE